ncbi:MAG: hypothetical protein J7K09_04430, partial [Desulfuromusa sp.]|nr:hypothetical protein [Desulfuromusa sp.]
GFIAWALYCHRSSAGHSFISDREKTFNGINIGLKKFRKILPHYLKILIFVAFPLANALHHKGACSSMIMTYLTAASLVMIPMSIVEATILGVQFTVVRLLVSLPLVIVFSVVIEKVLTRQRYHLPDQ